MQRRAAWLWLVAWAVWAGCDSSGRSAMSARTVLRAEPEVLRFGPSALGSTRTRTLTLTNAGRAPLRIESASSTSPHIQLAGFEPFVLPSGASRALEVTFAPEVEGDVQGALQLTTDDVEVGEGGVARVGAEGQGVRALVQLSAQALDFGNVSLETVEARTLTVRNATQVEATARLALTGPDADEFTAPAALGGSLTLQPGEVRTLSVAFKPGRLGAASAEARVTVCPGCEPQGVRLVGTGVAGALEVTPLRLDFGRVAVGARVEDRIVVRNNGTEPLVYEGALLVGDAGGAFALVSAPVPASATLSPGASAEVRLAFTPRAVGAATGGLVELRVRKPGTTTPGPKVPLAGEGGASCVYVTPRELDLGTVPEGMSATKRATLTNGCREEVYLSDVRLATTLGGYFSLAEAPASRPLAPGESLPLGVTFTPRTGAGDGAAQLTLKVAQGGSTSTERVSVKGRGEVLPACEWALEPAQALDFGKVPVGARGVLGVSVRNAGTGRCFVGQMGLAGGSDASFSAAPLESRLLEPGQRATLRVAFQPQGPGSYEALAEAYVNHPTLGHPTLPVRGEGVDGCFSVQPTTVDWGELRLACGPRTRQVLATNDCSVAVGLAEVALDSSGGDFVLEPGAALPTDVPPGGRLAFDVTYAPRADGDDAGALRVRTAAGDVYTVGLLGVGEEKPARTDRFLQESQAKVDVLFVVDNSGSMTEEQQGLGENFSAFLTAAQQQGVDIQVGVTTTGLVPSTGGWSPCPGGASGGEGGRLFPVDGSSPRIITSQTPNAAAVFATNARVGVCHWDEQGLEAARRALSDPLLHGLDDPRTPEPNDGNGGFVREDARLALVFVSDEEDFSPDSVEAYETHLRALKGNDPTRLTVSAVVGPEALSTCPSAASSGSRYIQLARATGGVVESICTPRWADSLERLGQNAFGPRRTFPLGEAPADPAAVEVRVNGVLVTGGWTYDAATRSVVFTPEAAPAAGSLVEITYPLGC